MIIIYNETKLLVLVLFYKIIKQNSPGMKSIILLWAKYLIMKLHWYLWIPQLYFLIIYNSDFVMIHYTILRNYKICYSRKFLNAIICVKYYTYINIYIFMFVIRVAWFMNSIMITWSMTWDTWYVD